MATETSQPSQQPSQDDLARVTMIAEDEDEVMEDEQMEDEGEDEMIEDEDDDEGEDEVEDAMALEEEEERRDARGLDDAHGGGHDMEE